MSMIVQGDIVVKHTAVGFGLCLRLPDLNFPNMAIFLGKKLRNDVDINERQARV